MSPAIYRHRALAAIFAIALAGCTSAPVRAPTGASPVWPPPPAPPRVVYEWTLRSQQSLAETTSLGRLKNFTGAAAVPREIMRKPYDVAAHGGLIAVSDTLAQVVHVFDVPRRHVFDIGRRGDGRLRKPLGVAVDGQRNIYVADAGTHRIQVYDAFGHLQRSVGEKDGLVRPSDVAVNEAGDRIYVVDAGGVDSDRHEVSIYDGSGTLIKVFGGRGTAHGRFNLPLQAALAPDGTLYVLDAGNFRVQAFDPDGRFLRAWGGVGVNFGNVARPRGIAVDTQGNVYVSDAAFQNFQIFNAGGQLLLPVGEAGATDGPGHFLLPAGIAVDETDRIYVADQLFRKVEVMRLLRNDELAAPAKGG